MLQSSHTKIDNTLNQIGTAFNDSFFHGRSIGNGCIIHTNSIDGCIQQIKQFFGNASGYRSADSSRFGGFVQQGEFVGSLE